MIGLRAHMADKDRLIAGVFIYIYIGATESFSERHLYNEHCCDLANILKLKATNNCPTYMEIRDMISSIGLDDTQSNTEGLPIIRLYINNINYLANCVIIKYNYVCEISYRKAN